MFLKGKKRPYNLLKSSADFQEAFKGLSRINEDNFKDIFEKIEEFLCHSYGLKNIKSVDEARFVLFKKAYTFKDINDVFQISTTNVDGSNLPPCKAELKKQLQRAAYISNIWCNAHEKQPTEMCAEDNGWIEIDGRYDFDWYEGSQLPTFISDVVIQPELSNTGKFWYIRLFIVIKCFTLKK